MPGTTLGLIPLQAFSSGGILFGESVCVCPRGGGGAAVHGGGVRLWVGVCGWAGMNP